MANVPYRVLLHNDSATPMELVVDVLSGVFGHPRDQAIELMREVHTTGMTEVARLSLREALVAVDRVHSLGAAVGAPLTASITPEHPLEDSFVASIPTEAMS